MLEMKTYYFTEEPFQEASYIDPTLANYRLNGKIFSIDGFRKPYNELFELIEKKKSICYLTSNDESRGTGKSAVLAAAYWKLLQDSEFSKKFFPVWVSVHDYRNITQLIGRILDSFVLSGLTDKIIHELPDTTPDSIANAIQNHVNNPSPTTLAAVSKILSVPKEELAWKYLNIKRSFPTSGIFEIFEYILFLTTSIDSRRIIVFVDQFEEYIEEQSYSSKNRTKMASDIKDIYRTMNATQNITIILTMHPKTQHIFENAAAEILNSYGQIPENAAFMEPINEKHLVKIALKYMAEYRIGSRPTNIDEYYPFTKESLEYLATRANGNPRRFLRFCYNALMDASFHSKKKIDMEFVNEQHQQIGLGAIETKSTDN